MPGDAPDRAGLESPITKPRVMMRDCGLSRTAFNAPPPEPGQHPQQSVAIKPLAVPSRCLNRTANIRAPPPAGTTLRQTGPLSAATASMILLAAGASATGTLPASAIPNRRPDPALDRAATSAPALTSMHSAKCRIAPHHVQGNCLAGGRSFHPHAALQLW